MLRRIFHRLPWLLVLALPAFAAVVVYRAAVAPDAGTANAARTSVVTAASAAATTVVSGSTAAAATASTSNAVAAAIPVTTVSAVSVPAPCAGFTSDAAVLANVAEVPLLPETGALGRRVLRRTKVDYSAPGNGVTVLQVTGVCPSAVAASSDPALCGLDGGATITPKPGASLTHWGAQFSAAALSVTVTRASDRRAGRAGRTWNAGTRRSGFVGFCATAADPIVEMRVRGQGVALTHLRHAFDPLGRPVDVGVNPSRETLALAADVAFERAILALQARERELVPKATLVAKYAPRLGLPSTTSYETLMRAFLRDPRYAEAFAIDLNAAMVPIRAETLRNVELKRAERDAEYRRIGYTPRQKQWTDVISGGANMNEGVHSYATLATPAILGTEHLVVSPLSLEWIAVPNAMEEIGEPATFCQGGDSCTFPVPYDLRPNQLWLRWHTTSLTSQQVADIVSENGYRLELTINGKAVHLGEPVGYDKTPPNPQGAYAYQFVSPGVCLPNERCFMTAILTRGYASGGVRIGDIPFPWDIRLKVYKLNPAPPTLVGIDENGNPIYAEKKKDLVANSTVTLTANPHQGLSYFQAAVYPTYTSERCEKCHGFETPEGVNNMHGMAPVKLAPSDFVAGAHVMTCNNCHEPYLTTLDTHGLVMTEHRWRLPHQDLGVNWDTMTPRQVCERTIQNLPTIELRDKHFHHDARLLWSVESALLPGYYSPVGTAAPHDYLEFLQHVDAWSTHSTPCPSY